jgi:predicted nucleic acid-binding protein
MKFWDSSAILPLVAAESATKAMRTIAAADPAMLVWWGTEIECASAVARIEREGNVEAAATAADQLRLLADSWHEVDPTDLVRETAKRFLRVHMLRAGDALQLAAAFVAADRRPPSLELVTLDDRLATAARKEGFVLVGI